MQNDRGGPHFFCETIWKWGLLRMVKLWSRKALKNHLLLEDASNIWTIIASYGPRSWPQSDNLNRLCLPLAIFLGQQNMQLHYINIFQTPQWDSAVPIKSHFFFFPKGAVAVKLGLTERLEAEPGDSGSKKTLHLQVAWVKMLRKNT